jgi:hypothetical protein
MAAAVMALRVMFRLQQSTAGTADHRPKAAGMQSWVRIILNMTQILLRFPVGVD